MQKISIHFASRYEQCCLVAFEHPYYEEGRCADLEVTAQSPTKAHLRRLGLVFRAIKGGMLLLYDESSDRGPAVQRIKEPYTLSFDVRLSNALFYQFTEIEQPKDGYGFHFSNWPEQRPAGKKMPLSQAELVGQSDAFPLQPPRFYYQLAVPYSGAAHIENERGQLIWEEDLSEVPGIAVDLREEDNGLYRLFLEGQPPFAFYRHYAPEGLFACIDIHIEPNVSHPYTLLLNQELQAQTYHLSFERRSLPCRYYFLNKNEEVSHTKHQVTDLNRNIKFTAAQDVTLENGMTAVHIESKTAIPLAERPSQRFRLKTRKGRNKAVVEQDLPQPTAKMVRPADATSGELCIEQIIYL